MKLDRRGVIGGAILAAALPLRALAEVPGRVVVNHIALEDGRVWMAAMIGDKGPYLFIVDTGGYVSMIEDAFAKQMGLARMPGRQSVGIGGVSDYSWYNAGKVTLASGFHFPDMQFAGVGKRLAKDAVGTFGAGLFTSYDSDLDFQKGEWRLYLDGRPNFDGLEKLRSRFLEQRGGERITAKASVNGFEGDFLLDSGAPGEVSLSGRAAEKSGLWNDSIPYAPMYSTGIGKARVPGRTVRAKELKIGTMSFPKVLARLSEPGTPSGNNDGAIGLPVMSQMHLTTDVSQKVVYAARNGMAPPKTGYPLSGLALDDDDNGRVTVSDVGTGSPAAKAGMKKGDVLAGTIRDLNAAVNGGPGKAVKLTIERGGAKQEVSYTLAPWL